MKRIILAALVLVCLPAASQEVLTLSDCRSLALRNNKQMAVSRTKQDVASNLRKSARTQYLPKVDAMGGYEFFNREISLLSSGQKATLSQLGTTLGQQATAGASDLLASLVGQGLLSPDAAQQLGSMLGGSSGALEQTGNAVGRQIVDAYHTDSRNIWAGTVMVRQPLYMGGAITAANRMAQIGEDMAANDLDRQRQSTLYGIDQAYWTVVSLRQKQKLAYSYRDLVRKLDGDVGKMIEQGVATRAEGLKVDVKVNEADMQVTQVEDGLALAKMLLCQLCGLPMDKDVALADEDGGQLADEPATHTQPAPPITARPEVRLLQNAIDMGEQGTRLARAAFLPHVALTGGYMVTNPNVFNGFQRKFAGVWNVGVMFQIPVWNWFEGAYKVRASKAATRMAQMEMADAQEKIRLQIAQSQFKVDEAWKRLGMARKNIKSAEENLRCANLGFKEGVMDATDVMTAQTAWQQAQSQKIDAEIEVRLARVALDKALGVLR